MAASWAWAASRMRLGGVVRSKCVSLEEAEYLRIEKADWALCSAEMLQALG